MEPGCSLRDELDGVRDELDELVRMRLVRPLTDRQQRRYSELAHREVALIEVFRGAA